MFAAAMNEILINDYALFTCSLQFLRSNWSNCNLVLAQFIYTKPGVYPKNN